MRDRCTRCGGDMFFERDSDGARLKCLQCGHTVELVMAVPAAPVSKGGPGFGRHYGPRTRNSPEYYEFGHDKQKEARRARGS